MVERRLRADGKRVVTDMEKLKEAGRPGEDGYERCVCCRRRVDIPKDMEIEFRPFYIEGAGQLCYDCYSELYGKS